MQIRMYLTLLLTEEKRDCIYPLIKIILETNSCLKIEKSLNFLKKIGRIGEIEQNNVYVHFWYILKHSGYQHIQCLSTTLNFRITEP